MLVCLYIIHIPTVGFSRARVPKNSLFNFKLKCVINFTCIPVGSGDASSTCSCWLLLLVIVVGIDMSLFCLLLQYLSKLVVTDAAEKRAHLMRLLDHPLQKKT